jgi:Leucine carboxyl methyltransferase
LTPGRVIGLRPRTRHSSSTSPDAKAVPAIGKISCIDFVLAELFGPAETQAFQKFVQFFRCEEQAKRLSSACYTSGKRIKCDPFQEAERSSRHCVVENHAAALRKLSEKPKRVRGGDFCEYGTTPRQETNAGWSARKPAASNPAASSCPSKSMGTNLTEIGNLGSGLDTSAYRGVALDSGLKVFEVDHPDTQKRKTDCLAAAAIPRSGIARHRGRCWPPTDLPYGGSGPP